MSRIPCPLCGSVVTSPQTPTLRDIPWVDDCACSDYSRCVYHQVYGEPGPERPSVDALHKRWHAQCLRDSLAWEARQNKYKAYEEQQAELEALRQQVVDLKTQLAELEAIEEVSLNACRELAKLQCVCAGYEGPDCVSCNARKALENK